MAREAVDRYVEANADRMVAELQECLRQPSFATNNEGMAEGVALTRAILERRGMQVEVLETSGHPAVLGVLPGTGPKSLLLYQHYDVLPPGDLTKWDSPPFDADVRDGKVFARGAADHKGSFMARVHAIDALLASGEPLPVTVKFLVEGEEELGSPHLAELVDRYRERLQADAALYSGWWKDEEDRPRINCGMRGGFKVRLTARGAAHGLHGRHAPLAPNAAWKLTWALASLKHPDERVAIDGFYDDVDPVSEEDEHALATIPFNEETLKATLGIDGFVAGVSGRDAQRRSIFEPVVTLSNVVVGDGSVADIPCIAYADLSLRLVPSQRPEAIVDALKAHLHKHGHGDIGVEVRSPLGEPARVPLDAPIARVVRRAAAEVYGVEPSVVPISSGSGPRYIFVNRLGVPMVADPGVGYDDQRDHGFNENIRLDDYFDGVRVMARIIEDLASEG